jgi:hypothetical protein
MALSKLPAKEDGIPEGFMAVPLEVSPAPSLPPLRLCVLVRRNTDPVEGHYVLLSDAGDASVYLGCIVDAAGRLVEWIELWVQNPNNLAGSPLGYLEKLSNDLLDRRWTGFFEAARNLAPHDCLTTGWEETHPEPTCLDPREGSARLLTGADSAKPWRLCRDDALLKAAGLPTYSHSAFRYLYEPDRPESPKFVPVVAGAPENNATLPLAKAVSNGDSLLPFNPHAGLMMARRFAPLELDVYSDLLSGKAWSGVGNGKNRFQPGGVYSALTEAGALPEKGAYLFAGPQGLAGRWVETFHLKLQLLTEAVRLVRSFVQRQQLPFLNLAADSFRVRLQPTGGGLPYLWTSTVALTKPSQALALPLEASEFRYFLPGKTPQPFIYLHEGIGNPVRGEGSVRIRQVMPPERGRTTVEGTLVTQEKLAISPHDLIWMRLPLASGRVDLYGHLYAAEGLAQGEARFRTLPLTLSDANRNALQAAAGTAISRAPFEVVPLLSTPCDLYALGVLAVRILLVNEENSLPIALDEILSLARQVAASGQTDTELKWRLRSLFEQDPRWQASLGPHRLSHAKMDPAEAAHLVPMELWWQALAEVVRFFPGLGPDSFCKDFGDAPALALESVFDPPLRDLEKVLIQTRSLLFIDWNQNREIHAVIKTFRQPAAPTS